MNFIFQFLFILAIIIGGHYLYEYVKNKNTQKISKNIYHAQVEKYKNIVEEIEQEHMNKQNMEDDLMNYVENELLV
jgi:uncharacterized membrane protein YhiD involved in acid resistance